jgi:hypothetical protein
MFRRYVGIDEARCALPCTGIDLHQDYPSNTLIVCSMTMTAGCPAQHEFAQQTSHQQQRDKLRYEKRAGVATRFCRGDCSHWVHKGGAA